ncbi:MAG: cell division protein ZapA [bacterium]|jgi:cell division protein ZapA|nr:cell division protein ZapA [bacterium]
MELENDIISIEILGIRLQLRGGEDPERVRYVAEYVKQVVEELAARTPTAPSIQIALLSAINIADELYQMTNNEDAALEEAVDKAQRILAKMQPF